jgi:ABC-type amino acid transport substrate-binding protein
VALYLLLFSSVAISSQPESAEIQVKRVKIELITDIDYRPYSYQEDGKAKGLLIDIVHQVATYDGWLDESIKTREVDTVNVFEFPNASLALLGVYNDIVDCTLFEKVSFVETSKQLFADGKIKDLNKLSIGSVLSQNSLHIGYSEKIMRASSLTDKAANPYQFQKAFDAEFFKMLQSGELAPIFLKYGTQYR